MRYRGLLTGGAILVVVLFGGAMLRHHSAVAQTPTGTGELRNVKVVNYDVVLTTDTVTVRMRDAANRALSMQFAGPDASGRARMLIDQIAAGKTMTLTWDTSPLEITSAVLSR